MLRRMSSAELTEWLAFYDLEPFGGDTQYLGHAIVATTVANCTPGRKGRSAEIEDFMPKFDRKKSGEQTVDEQIQFAAVMTAAMGGTIDIKDNGE